MRNRTWHGLWRRGGLHCRPGGEEAAVVQCVPLGAVPPVQIAFFGLERVFG